MGKLVIDGNKVYTVDEDCMRRKNLSLSQIRRQENDDRQQGQHGRQDHWQRRERGFYTDKH